MIAYLTGKIISKKPTKIILDVNGVGYLVNISITTFEKISDNSDVVSLFIVFQNLEGVGLSHHFIQVAYGSQVRL